MTWVAVTYLAALLTILTGLAVSNEHTVSGTAWGLLVTVVLVCGAVLAITTIR
jgi:hypothetical protein